VIWHDGQGACLFSKRLDCSGFIWPTPCDGSVTISPAQLGYILEGRENVVAGARRATNLGRV
jgi:transposase